MQIAKGSWIKLPGSNIEYVGELLDQAGAHATENVPHRSYNKTVASYLSIYISIVSLH